MNSVVFVVLVVSVVIGLAVVMWRRLARARVDIDVLSARIGSLERLRAVPPQRATSPPAAPAPQAAVPTPEPRRPDQAAKVVAPSRTSPPPRTPPPPPPSSGVYPGVDPGVDPGADPDIVDRFTAWLFGGNTVVRVGVVVLFFGVGFFLNYVAERGWLPVEARLSLAATAGFALAVVGWRLRDLRRDYALVLQGGGIGIVYLTVFAAVNLYNLVDAGPGLFLMVILVALSSALAVLQDARSLAVLAALGGFLAPVIVSSDGSHVGLFSYYAVLDVGILAIAWFKAWPMLNRLGFLCTFVFSAAWGAQYYQPAYFGTTEPFLIAFFLFYVAVPVLFARQEQAAGSSSVDGSLLFGVPLIAFGLQAALVRDFEYGLAYSALGAGLVYVALASALWRRFQDGARLLVEIFLALGVAFGTIAIPLAFDGRWTGSAWALEGAGLIWIGIRQRRPLACVAGVCLQVVAGLSFFLAPHPQGDMPVLNSVYLGALLISLGGFFSAWFLDRGRSEIEDAEASVSVGLIAWGLCWWCGAGLNEISVYVPIADHGAAYLFFGAVSSMILTIFGERLPWPPLRVLTLLLLPAMALVAVRSMGGSSHPLAGWGAAAWMTAVITHFWVQWRDESEWPERVGRGWHQGMLWLIVFLASWEAGWVMERLAGGSSTWFDVAWAVIPGAAILSVVALARQSSAWPFQSFGGTYLKALIPVATFLGLWVLCASFMRGNPAPLAYVPLVNPLELAQCLSLVILLKWSAEGEIGISAQSRWLIWSTLAFAVLNGMIARATHFYGGVAFDLTSLWSSAPYQAAISIVWTLSALIVMTGAARLTQRPAWFAGAVLLGAVVVKLFLVELDDVGTVARIVSFVGVGLLMLLVGYVSPLPPRLREQSQS